MAMGHGVILSAVILRAVILRAVTCGGMLLVEMIYRWRSGWLRCLQRAK